ncbi:DUF2024 family protein [uncultured Cytophaga sp.]|uniref:DUF2024 family protein n=1 Tax=uncultured Cytophaga sp. TaxID=160238 RepID=UPI002613DBA8|nr:DUF2024 family protein [uncultured Cytophaga sp.]
MQVAVWDTYVTKKDTTVMHFDIVVPSEVTDASIIYNYGKLYLISKAQEGQALTYKECSFCHIEALEENRVAEIHNNGFFIIEM